MVTSTFATVHVLGEGREILQSIKHMPHKHEDLDSISNPCGKSGMWCVLEIPVQGGVTGSLGLIGQPLEHSQQDPGTNETLGQKVKWSW